MITPSADEVQGWAPERIARHSPRARRADRVLREAIDSICDSSLRQRVTDTLATLDLKEGFSLLAETPAVRRRYPKTCERLAATLPYHPWWGAPGAAASSHHPYPGGWLIHNATNIRSLQGLILTATTVRGLKVHSDTLIAAMLLHDWAKPRMFFWHGAELKVDEGELGHHVAALCEMALRGFPREVLVCLAGVHGGWWDRPEAVQGFFEKAAEVLDRPELASWGRAHASTRETIGWMARLGETSWYKANREALQSIRTPLRDWLSRTAGSEFIDTLQAMIFGWVDELELAEAFARNGAPHLEKLGAHALERAREALKAE